MVAAIQGSINRRITLQVGLGKKPYLKRKKEKRECKELYSINC
jgi:hypothetical protein